jgi:hypothetical protein
MSLSLEQVVTQAGPQAAVMYSPKEEASPALGGGCPGTGNTRE